MTIRRAMPSELIDLRHRILRPGLPRETAMFPGDDDVDAIHLLATENDQPIGCATIHLNEWSGRPAWQLRGMAVATSHQGQGIGGKLLSEAESVVRESNVQQFWCNARVAAIRFYLRHGWQVVSEEFEIPASGPHVKMIKTIS